MTTSPDIRCPTCSRLLGRASPAGAIEIRRAGRLLAAIERGVLSCPRCAAGVVVVAAPPRPPPPLALAAAGG